MTSEAGAQCLLQDTLRLEVERLKRELMTAIDARDLGQYQKKKTQNRKTLQSVARLLISVVVLVGGFVLIYKAYNADATNRYKNAFEIQPHHEAKRANDSSYEYYEYYDKDGDHRDDKSSTSSPHQRGSSETPVDTLPSSKQGYYFNIGMRSDPLLQDCQGPRMKRTFPDLDYVLLGYDILKGYPLQVGHDPGFTLPLFQADYRDGRQTADCRYSVPKGLVLIPDVACVTSFSSKIVKTRYEFAETLSTSVSASGGGWGVSFSASAGYKESSASISSGESMLVISKATCDYYFSRLLQGHPPPFDLLFLEWVQRLAQSSPDDETLYYEFFEQYGTHFLAEVTFGASFVYEHEMKTQQYETMSEKGINVAVAASYSGLFSVGGGFNLDMSQKEAASDFQKSVTTKTITRGAPPPANGDALTWASSVKESPVPVKYRLLSIEELFSKKYMQNVNIKRRHYLSINDNIQKHKIGYCQFLKAKGQVESCKNILPGIVLKGTRLLHYYKAITADLGTCQDKCADDRNCTAISKCTGCESGSFYAGKCYLFSEGKQKSALQREGWESMIFRPKITEIMQLTRARIEGVNRNERRTGADDVAECKRWCVEDEQCIAYSFCSDRSRVQNCALFGQDGILGFKTDFSTNSFIFGLRLRLPSVLSQ